MKTGGNALRKDPERLALIAKVLLGAPILFTSMNNTVSVYESIFTTSRHILGSLLPAPVPEEEDSSLLNAVSERMQARI